jgi:hypothetical protein
MVKIPDIRHDANYADFLQFSSDSSSLVLDAISSLFNVKNIEKLTNMLLNVVRT